MTTECRGDCKTTYRFDRQGGNSQLHIQGAKRCQQCDGRYIRWDGIFCPCCGSRLRLKPRKSKLKEKVLIENQVIRL